MPISRRQFIQLGAQGAALVAAGRFATAEAARQRPGAHAAIHDRLDRFVEQYLRDMNAPGMTLVLADREGVQRVATYGFGDPALHARIAPDALFEIGSISKSFVAIALLQLVDEGRLDLHEPITDLLPWLRLDTPFGPVSAHDLLTHASGLPGNPPLFLSDPAARHRTAYAPGEHFHYSNTAFEALGHLLAKLDGCTLGESIRRRVFEPLGMARSESVISFESAGRMARSWWAAIGDRPYPRFGPLGEAPAIMSSDGAGCILSTAHDMGLYIGMLANAGKGPRGALLSDASFQLFSKPHIKAEEFGPTAGYGYGIAVDTLDGHRIVRHTGGMVSFASAIEVDLDEGVGCFASINAMQGFRPMPVVEYANRLMRAQRARKPLPALPKRDDPTLIEDAADYAGTFEGADGRSLVFVAEGKRLFLMHQGQRVAIESGVNGVLVRHPDWSRFALVFRRVQPKDPKSAVAEVSWGGDWYANAHYAGPRRFTTPPEWQAYAGHYRNESPWVGSLHVVVLKHRLTIEGQVPLKPAGEGRFVLEDEERSPEWIAFADLADGKAMRIKLSGEDYWRFE